MMLGREDRGGRKYDGRSEWLSEQLQAVRDACNPAMFRDGRSVPWHLHVVWCNYQDFFLDHRTFLTAIVQLGSHSQSRQFAKSELEAIGV